MYTNSGGDRCIFDVSYWLGGLMLVRLGYDTIIYYASIFKSEEHLGYFGKVDVM